MATKLAEAPVEEAGANGHIRGLLTAADILDAEDIKSEYVEVPEWGGTVKIVGLTGEQRNKVGALMRAESKKSSEDDALAYFQMRIAAAAMVDEEGKRLFSQNDVVKLAKKSASAIQRVYAVAARLAGIGDEALEEARESLKATPSADTGIE